MGPPTLVPGTQRHLLGTPLEEAVAERLHNTCVPDHETYTYSGRPIAERMAFIRQARAVIPLIQSWSEGR